MSKYIFNNDAEILEFLEQLREKSIQIWAEGEKIRYRSKNGQLAPEILGTLKMAKGQILDFLRMVEKNVIPLTAIQTAYVVGHTAGCELGNVNAHYYIEYTIESLNVERLEQMINLVISKNDVFLMDKRYQNRNIGLWMKILWIAELIFLGNCKLEEAVWQKAILMMKS